MNTCNSAFANAHPEGESATRRLARPDGRLALSLRLAGMSLPRCGKKALGRSKLSCGPRGGAGAPRRGVSGGRALRARHPPRRTRRPVRLAFLG